jgi:hypothetical protein
LESCIVLKSYSMYFSKFLAGRISAAPRRVTDAPPAAPDDEPVEEASRCEVGTVLREMAAYGRFWPAAAGWSRRALALRRASSWSLD